MKVYIFFGALLAIVACGTEIESYEYADKAEDKDEKKTKPKNEKTSSKKKTKKPVLTANKIKKDKTDNTENKQEESKMKTESKQAKFGEICLYTEADYAGNEVCYNESVLVDTMDELGGSIGSFKIDGQLTLITYSRENIIGDATQYTESTSSLEQGGFFNPFNRQTIRSYEIAEPNP